MSEDKNLQGYGFVADDADDLQSKQGAKFGGNFGVAYVKSFEYKENVAKEGNPAREAIEVELQVRDRMNKAWFSPINKVFGENQQELQPGEAGYKEGFNAQMIQQNATITHYLKALGVSEDALKNSLNKKFESFKDFAMAVIGLLPTGFESKPLDVFFEYQWKIGTKADGTPRDKTYPTLPKNMKGGYFLVPAQPGEWSEVRGDDGSLTYVNSEGTAHPFRRDEAFMSSNKGTQQVLNSDGDADTAENPMAQGEAKSAGW